MLDNENYANFDSDGDGILDSHIDFTDSETGEMTDTWMVDLDGDGVADGYVDTSDESILVDSYDMDGDGVADVTEYSFDNNGDGYTDTFVTELDIDGDAQADLITYEADLNGDGTIDFAEAQLIDGDAETDDLVVQVGDLDFDGDVDTFNIGADEDIFEPETEEDYDVFTEEVEPEVEPEPEIEPDVDTETDYGYTEVTPSLIPTEDEPEVDVEVEPVDEESDYAAPAEIEPEEDLELDTDRELNNDTYLNYDSDGDGKMDSHIDFNNDYTDNVSDLWLIDKDGDGKADDFITTDDENVTVEGYDLNGDGKDDISIFTVDTDGDGDADITVTELDIDGDGKADVITYENDLNGDGKADYVEMQIIGEDNSTDDIIVRAADTDFDGEIDEFSINTDEDYFFKKAGDMDLDAEDEETESEDVTDPSEEAEVEAEDESEYYGDETEADDSDEATYADETEEPVEPEETYTDDSEVEVEEDDTEALILPELDYDTNNDNGVHYSELTKFDASDADKEGVIGDPEDSMNFWEYQGDTNRCAVYAQKFIIEEHLGYEVDIEDLVDVAEENGWFDEDIGTYPADMDKLLTLYGIPHETSTGNDIEYLAECLAEGKEVIVAVDAEEYWYGENDGDGIYVPGDGINHAVEVIGIDYSDPDNPMVILNDSGYPDGQGVEIPMDTFIDAWEDGNNYMIEC